MTGGGASRTIIGFGGLLVGLGGLSLGDAHATLVSITTVNADSGLASDLVAWVIAHAQAVLATAYDRAPALVIVLTALFIVPLTAMVALLAHASNFTRPLRFATGPSQAHASLVSSASSELTPWPTKAWLTIEGVAERKPLPHRDDLVRIGRHDDNEICISHVSVHRHHALVHKTSDGVYMIVDLSGRAGNGILVNGERLAESRLTDGDSILLGEVGMRFESAPL